MLGVKFRRAADGSGGFRRKIRVVSSKSWFGLILVGCSALSTEPDLSRAQGTYVLEKVNGAPLPITIESGDCPREIFRGDLGLSPGVVDQRPLYDLLVSLRLRCDPDRLLFIDQRRLIEDVGEWTIDGNRVEFRSSKGFGTFRIPIETGSPTPTALLTLQLDGRSYTFRRVSQ